MAVNLETSLVRWLSEAKNVLVNQNWVSECLKLAKLKQADKFLSLLQLQDYVYQQWLSSNLGESGVPTLPVSKQAESYSHIETETILQINWLYDVSTSCYSQLLKIKNCEKINDFEAVEHAGKVAMVRSSRMLFMEVTDGDTVLLAIEYEPVHELSEELPCGTKIQLTSEVTCRDGVLLFVQNCLKVLGGSVESLNETKCKRHLLENILKNQTKMSFTSEVLHRATFSESLSDANGAPQPLLLPNAPTAFMPDANPLVSHSEANCVLIDLTVSSPNYENSNSLLVQSREGDLTGYKVLSESPDSHSESDFVATNNQFWPSEMDPLPKNLRSHLYSSSSFNGLPSPSPEPPTCTPIREQESVTKQHLVLSSLPSLNNKEMRPNLENPPAPRHMDPPTPRHMDPPTPRHMDPPTPRHMDPPAHRHMDPPTPRRMDSPAPRHMDPPTPRHMDLPTPRRMDPPTPRHMDPPTPRHMDLPTPRRMDPPTPRHMDPPTPRHMDPPTPRHMDSPAPRHMDPLTLRHMDSPAPRPMDPPTPRHMDPPTPRHMDSPAPRRMDPPTPRHMDPSTPRHMDPPIPRRMDPLTPRHMDRPTPRYMDPLTPRHMDPPTPRHMDPLTLRHMDPPTPRHMDPPAHRRMDPPAHRRMDPPTPRHMDPPAPRRVDPPAHRHMDPLTPRRMDPPAHRHMDPPTPRRMDPPTPIRLGVSGDVTPYRDYHAKIRPVDTPPWPPDHTHKLKHSRQHLFGARPWDDAYGPRDGGQQNTCGAHRFNPYQYISK